MSVIREKKKRAMELALAQRRKLLAAFIALAGLAGAAFFLHQLTAPKSGLRSGLKTPPANNEHRQSSSVSDYDPDLYANDSIEDLERASRADAAKTQLKKSVTKEKAVLPFEPIKGQAADQVADQVATALQKTGISGRRAREVILRPEVFLDSSDEYRISLNLFNDFTPVAVMQRPSVYGVNQAFHVGQLLGDPSSQVQLMIAEGQMNGTIKTQNRTFRIVSLGSGHHYVIEVDSTSSKH